MTTNAEKAQALLRTFESGDEKMARSLLREDYIEHHVTDGTGVDAFVETMKHFSGGSEKTRMTFLRVFEDEDTVFLHVLYHLAGEGDKVAFDIFRFDETGRIAEHWDNLEDLETDEPARLAQIGGSTQLEDLEKTGENRALIRHRLESKNATIHQVRAQGNFVLSVVEDAEQSSALYDLWRLRAGEIVEHWSIQETIPPRNMWKNENGKF